MSEGYRVMRIATIVSFAFAGAVSLSLVLVYTIGPAGLIGLPIGTLVGGLLGAIFPF
jgi:hypothetical protein